MPLSVTGRRYVDMGGGNDRSNYLMVVSKENKSIRDDPGQHSAFTTLAVSENGGPDYSASLLLESDLKPLLDSIASLENRVGVMSTVQHAARDAFAETKAEIEAMKFRLTQSEYDAELLWDLHRQAEHLGDKTFLTSNCKRFYRRSLAIANPDDFWQKVKSTLLEFYTDAGQGSMSSIHSQTFALQLRADVESNHGEASAALAGTCTWMATRAWTSTAQDPLYKREWCGILNQITREDKAPVIQESSYILATMAGFSVADRVKAAPSIAWPTDWTLSRGLRMPEQHVSWYEAHVGEHVRIPQSLPTTKHKDASTAFMNIHSYPNEVPKAMMVLKLDENLRCDHVSCLESLTLAPGEQEFLFPPYSAFKIASVERKSGFNLITLDVVSDNRSIPEDVPLTPWA